MSPSRQTYAGFIAAFLILLAPLALKAQEESTAPPVQIKVTVLPAHINKHTREVFKIDLVNATAKDLWIYKLVWECSGLYIEIFDSKGKRLEPRGHWGLPPLPPRPDHFLPLKPGEVLSTTSPGDLFDLGVTKQGSYSARVYYFHQVETVDGELRVRFSHHATKSEPIQFSVK